MPREITNDPFTQMRVSRDSARALKMYAARLTLETGVYYSMWKALEHLLESQDPDVWQTVEAGKTQK